eukprot:1422303-Amphidinium_carterae.2
MCPSMWGCTVEFSDTWHNPSWGHKFWEHQVLDGVRIRCDRLKQQIQMIEASGLNLGGSLFLLVHAVPDCLSIAYAGIPWPRRRMKVVKVVLIRHQNLGRSLIIFVLVRQEAPAMKCEGKPKECACPLCLVLCEVFDEACSLQGAREFKGESYNGNSACAKVAGQSPQSLAAQSWGYKLAVVATEPTLSVV